jgi:hypothetical protein
MQLRELDRRTTREKSQPRQATATVPVASKYAIDEINAYIAIRDNLLSEAEATTTNAILRRLSLANDFVQSCLKRARSPYEAQSLPESDGARERERCEAVKIRIAELGAQIKR